MTESEVWKDIAECEGFYQVSNRGSVRSMDRRDSRGRKLRGRVLKPAYNRGGYLTVGLCKNGKSKTKRVHRLVAETFLPNPKGFLEVNHKDENKSNNYANNLEWCTREHNANYGTQIERAAQARSKKVKAINIKTGEALTFNSAKEAGLKGYSHKKVSEACRGAYKTSYGKLIGGDGRTYKGYKWYYDVEEENVSKRVSMTT